MQAVQDEGGFETVVREKKWPKIAVCLCYQASKNIGSTLRQNYDKILYPFDAFMSGATADVKVEHRQDYLQTMILFRFAYICYFAFLIHHHMVVTSTLVQLHWLLVQYHITYKLCLLMHLTHTSQAPSYFTDIVTQTAGVTDHKFCQAAVSAINNHAHD